MTDNPATDVVANKAIDDDAGLALAQMAKDGRPTRADDTVVIEGGWRAPSERFGRTSQLTLRRAAMGDPDGPPLQRRDILSAFNRHEVDSILVRGVAAQAQYVFEPAR